MDSDLRRPSLHTLFDLPETPGLTTMVLDEAAEPPLQQTSAPNVSLVASGPLPPNPAELLASERFARVIARIAATGDVVLFDAAPVAAVTDATVLATRVDGVLLVVDAGRTRRDVARRSEGAVRTSRGTAAWRGADQRQAGAAAAQLLPRST